MSPPRYLGDGVYAEFDGYHIWLTTTRSEGQPERIALEPMVFGALMRYARTVWPPREIADD